MIENRKTRIKRRMGDIECLVKGDARLILIMLLDPRFEIETGVPGK